MDAIGVGERLRRARQALGWSLQAVAANTRIPERHLDALESDRFGDLPGPVYAKGFLRNYATYLGLSPDELIQELVAARAFAGEGEPPASVHPETRVAASPARRPTSRLVAPVALAAAVAAVYLVYHGLERPHGAARSGRPATSADAGAAAAGAASSPSLRVAAPATAAQGTSAPTGQAAPLTGAAGRLPAAGQGSPVSPSAQQAIPAPPAPAPVTLASPPARATPGAAPAPGSLVSQASPAPPGAAAAPPSVRPGAAQSVRVEIAASAQAWVRAIVDGRAVYDGVLAPGERRVWAGRREVILSTTNAGAVAVAVDGRPLGRLGNPDQIIERSFAPAPAPSP
jgi:cytoskeleton protein RodZ